MSRDDVLMTLDAGWRRSGKLESSSTESLLLLPSQADRCLDLARFFVERTNLESVWISVYVPLGTAGSETNPERQYGSHVVPATAILRWRWQRPERKARKRPPRKLVDTLAAPSSPPAGGAR